MNRLTEKDTQGNWRLKGVPWESLHVGQTITEELRQKLYGALWKLMEYEDTGMSPEDIELINKFEGRNKYRTKESETMKLIDYIAKTQGLPMAEIIEGYCPSDFHISGCDDCTGCKYISDYEHNDCEKCWNKEIKPEDIPHTCDTCRRYGRSDHNCYYCRHKNRPDMWEPKEG